MWVPQAFDPSLSVRQIRATPESAFHSDWEFWDYASSHYRSICDLRLRGLSGRDERPVAEERSRREGLLKNIASTVNAGKRKWEREWYKSHRQLIIIGDVSQKLKIGFSPVAEKQYPTLLALNNLYDFLNEKVMDTMPFNFWFHEDDSVDGKLQIFEFVRDKIVKDSPWFDPS
jgi:hypothetical protein